MNEAGRIKVLHIDDDEGFLELFRNTYSEEFDIISLPGGDDVPCIVEREAPGALVLDYELPGRNGLELLSAIKEKYPSLPVIFYTGQGNEEIARQAFREGATDYFVKKSADFAQKEKVVNSIQKAIANRAVEEELAEKQAMLEGIIELNPYSINIIDSSGHFVKTNKAFMELWGNVPPPDIDQMKMIENIDNSYIKLNNRLRNGESVKYPPVWMSPQDFKDKLSGNKVCVGSMAFPIKNNEGMTKYYVIMHEDITARVEAEEALRNAHEELTGAHEALRSAYDSVEHKVSERTAELADANTQLADANLRLTDANTRLQAEIEERVRLQGQLERQNSELEGFSRTVSHDLRNNLNAMQRLMERGAMAADDKERTQKLLIENTAHLQHFVERLLDLAQAGKAISEKRKVSLDVIARKVFPLAAASHGKVAAEGKEAADDGKISAANGKSTASQGEAELFIITPFSPVLCDPGAFEQIFSNLFNNAFAHARPDVKALIQLECAVKDGTAEITVQDNGKGIEPGIASRIFDSTFTTKKGEHFGLGLAIVKKLVEAHGGKVRVESEGPGEDAEKETEKGAGKGTGKGAAFIITLPHDGQGLEQRLC